MDTQRVDVVIVGGGLVGATMACLLQDTALKVALVDKGSWPGPSGATREGFDPRVSALTSASKACLGDLGLWSRIEDQRCCPYQEMTVWDADGTGHIHFSAADLNEPELGTIVENTVVLGVLRERLAEAAKETENMRVYTGQAVASLLLPKVLPQAGASERALLTTDKGLRIETDLVIAADGAGSPLRSMAGFRTREWDYGHTALVTTVRTELPHRHTAWQRFMDTGPLAFLPLSPASGSDEQHYSSIVWSLLPERAEALMALADADFCRELGFSFEHRLGAIEWADKRYSFPLRQRHAVDYVQPGIALIGDAAHTIHPLAGQGVNLGILDAQALAANLKQAVAGGRCPGDLTVLKRYQRARIGHNLGMMGVMEGFKHLFASQSLPLRWLRNMGMSGVDRVTVVKNQLARRAMGLEPL